MRIVAQIGIAFLAVLTIAGFFSSAIEKLALETPQRVAIPEPQGLAMPMSTRFELFVSNPRASARFYSDFLGFRTIEEKAQEGGAPYIAIENGFVRIGLQSASRLFGLPVGLLRYFRTPPIGTEIVLEVDDLGEVYERVRRAGYPIQAPVQVQPWGLRDFRLFDPDWYYLRITTRR